MFIQQPRPWYVYLVRCSDQSLYCGITNNPQKRLNTHNKGKGSRYCRSRLPVALVWIRQCPSRSEALKMEHSIKLLNRIEKEALISVCDTTEQWIDSTKQANPSTTKVL